VLGVLCGTISQLGDWTASAIKRFVKVKDFGNIMPGHGGALDRFDSILFTAPVLYFYISFIV
jgi:phosphatidate cytidylyltransferase